jgi:MFS family permease
MNVMTPCAFISAVLSFCFIPTKSVASLIVLAALYGFFSGTFVSSPTATVVRLSSHSRGNLGTRLGQCFGAVSFGLLIGMLFLSLSLWHLSLFIFSVFPWVLHYIFDGHSLTVLKVLLSVVLF